MANENGVVLVAGFEALVFALLFIVYKAIVSVSVRSKRSGGGWTIVVPPGKLEDHPNGVKKYRKKHGVELFVTQLTRVFTHVMDVCNAVSAALPVPLAPPITLAAVMNSAVFRDQALVMELWNRRDDMGLLVDTILERMEDAPAPATFGDLAAFIMGGLEENVSTMPWAP